MNVTSSGIVNGVIQPQYGGHGTQFNVNGIPTYALRGTIFIQAAHRICKPGQAGGGNGIGGKHILVTETAPISDEWRKTIDLFLDFPYWIYAFRSILYAFRSLHPKITKNLPIN